MGERAGERGRRREFVVVRQSGRERGRDRVRERERAGKSGRERAG